jgi:hypothetical protein
MHKFRTLAVSALALIALVAFAVGGASACDGKTSASTASADMQVAGTGCTASAKTASADAKLAGAGCSAHADAKVAGAACCAGASPAKVAMETVRMPSGALAVFYNGADAETISTLQAGVAAKGANFGCGLAGAMAGNENCTVEAANTAHGIMLLVSSEKSELIDEFQQNYAVAMTQHAHAEQGGE